MPSLADVIPEDIIKFSSQAGGLRKSGRASRSGWKCGRTGAAEVCLAARFLIQLLKEDETLRESGKGKGKVMDWRLRRYLECV